MTTWISSLIYSATLEAVLEFDRKTLPLKTLILDVDNPRFWHLQELKRQAKGDEEQIMAQIRTDNSYITLMNAIRRAGVTDPIWVRPGANGKYLVFEGNRRTTVLRDLIAEGVKAPEGVRYDAVQANVVPKDTSDTDLLLQRVRLQTGKDPWEAFNTAMAIWKLRYEKKLEEDDIAFEAQKSRTKVRETLLNVKLLTEYSKATKDTDPHQFSMFAQAPKKVRDWMSEDTRNKELYFKLISPMKGPARIRSAATKGGLREFALILDNPDILEKFVKDKEMTVEDAVDLLSERDVKVELPFIKKIGTLAAQLSGLTDEQIERLQKEKKVVLNIKKLQNVCSAIVSKLDD